MKIVVVCAGSRGDVQPYAALALGLARAGHQVRMVTHQEFRPLLGDQAVDFFPLAPNPRELLDDINARRAFAFGHNPVVFLRSLFQLWQQFIEPFLEACRQGCSGAATVIYSTLAFPAYHVAESTGALAVGAFLQPLNRTRAFPAPGFPAPGPLKRWGAYNRFTYWVMEMQAWLMVRQGINRWREQTLGLPPLPLSGPYPRIYRGEIPILYGYSQTVAPRPPDWPPSFRVTGYWFLDQADGYTPPADLLAFLNAGPAPVYVGFGSMRSQDPLRLGSLAVQALQRAGQRGVLQTGWGALGLDDPPDNIYVLREPAPHDWLFPQMAAVVHHGGAGTTATGLRAGRPTVITPFLADQFFWGDRVAALGAGPRPLPIRRLREDDLTEAIQRAATDPGMKASAAAIGTKLRAEDGVAEAVGWIEALGRAGST